MLIFSVIDVSSLCTPINQSVRWRISRRKLEAGADWAAWQLPGGPVGPPARWATTSNVEVGQTTYLVGEWHGGKGEKGARDKVTKEKTGTILL